MSKPVSASIAVFRRQFATQAAFVSKRPYNRNQNRPRPGQFKENMIIPSTYWKICKNVIAIGRNYADHITELGNQRPTKPFYFLKPWTSIIPPDSLVVDEFNPRYKVRVKKPSHNVLIPNGVNVHYEVELAVIFQKEVSDLAYQRSKLSAQAYEELWKDAIGGYALAIDLTARNLQDEAKKAGLPWSAAKGYHSFLPISLFIPKEKIPDPHNVRLQLQVNGETKQDDKTDLMIFKIPELMEAVTDVMPLIQGDILLTGTPKGVGQIVAGDVMKASAFVDDQLIESFEITAEDRKHPDGTPW